METMNIALPDSLKEFVRERIAEGGYSGINEYMQELIRADRKRSARQLLETEIVRGLNSGESTPMTDADWDRLRDELRNRSSSRV